MDSFAAGMNFHFVLDEIREDFVVSRNLYSLCRTPEIIRNTLKFYEDELLYGKIKDWDEIVGFFQGVLRQERETGIVEKDIKSGILSCGNIFPRRRTTRPAKNYVGTRGFIRKPPEK